MAGLAIVLLLYWGNFKCTCLPTLRPLVHESWCPKKKKSLTVKCQMVDHDKTMWQNALSSTDVNLWVLRNHLTGNVIRASTQLGDLLYSGSHSTQVAKTLASSTFFVEWLLIVSLIPWMSVLFESLWMKKRNENLRARFLFLDAILMRTNRQWWLGKKLSCRGEKSQVYEKITCHRLGASLWLLNNARPMFDQLSCSGDYSPFHFMCYMCAFEAGS